MLWGMNGRGTKMRHADDCTHSIPSVLFCHITPKHNSIWERAKNEKWQILNWYSLFGMTSLWEYRLITDRSQFFDLPRRSTALLAATKLRPYMLNAVTIIFKMDCLLYKYCLDPQESELHAVEISYEIYQVGQVFYSLTCCKNVHILPPSIWEFRKEIQEGNCIRFHYFICDLYSLNSFYAPTQHMEQKKFMCVPESVI